MQQAVQVTSVNDTKVLLNPAPGFAYDIWVIDYSGEAQIPSDNDQLIFALSNAKRVMDQDGNAGGIVERSRDPHFFYPRQWRTEILSAVGMNQLHFSWTLALPKAWRVPFMGCVWAFSGAPTSLARTSLMYEMVKVDKMELADLMIEAGAGGRHSN